LPRGQAGGGQQLPEAVCGAGEMVAGLGRAPAGIETGEQHGQAGADDIAHFSHKVLPVAGLSSNDMEIIYRLSIKAHLRCHGYVCLLAYV